jgi:hypothetical protein
MIEGAIRTVLIGDATVQGLISGRAYPAIAVQDPTFPFCTYQRVSTTRELAQSGPVNVAEATFQINCFGEKPLDAYTLAQGVTNLFHGLRQIVGSDEILLARVVNQVEFSDEDAKTYQVAVDISVAYRE